MSLSAASLLRWYGLFLIAGGFFAFAMAGFEARAKTAIFVGSACGAIMFALGFFGRTRPILIKIGRGLLVFFLGLFSFRGYKIIDVAEKRYLLYCFIVLSTATLLTILLQACASTDAGKRQKTKASASKQQQD